ncbi:Uu.00g116540.m01.CDS01 [Anthostomella pinea]|uniref:Non-structural maintenance of chromosomes element 4 n=1 Tax=Anthostomella pinea TaxID=933095 RepID=A0AAI8YGR6_9PEZI|nr:Uu.00g116540.m01.CDS01 [Anthostomella pinea]
MSDRSSSPTSGSPGSSPDRDSRKNILVMRDKGKAPEGSSKRKRTLTNGTGASNSRRRTREPEVIEDGDDTGSFDYDPNQPLDERRQVQRGFRDIIRDVTENADEYLKPESLGLHDAIRRANELSGQVKQTSEATIDSKLLVNTADASYRKTVRLTSGNIAQGVDVDEFVSKCITYMRLGSGIAEDDAPGLTATQQQRRRPNRVAQDDDGDDDEIGDEGDMFNWEHLGRFASLPHVRRPAVPGFLLGPLSVEKKVRKVVKRSAPFRPGNLQETRPEVLNAEDVQRSEKNDLTAICSKILRRLEQVQEEAQTKVDDAYQNQGASEEEAQRLMDKYALRSTGGIDLLKFVVNPKSFGQTVENMFYVSFLIRDGRVEIDFDDNDLPTLQPVASHDESGHAKSSARKQQAVLSIDMQMWHDIIDAFNIIEPIIEHRKEQRHQGPGARGWYS